MADTLVTPSRWLAPLPDAQSVGARGILLCFPYGGGGASSFQGLSSYTALADRCHMQFRSHDRGQAQG